MSCVRPPTPTYTRCLPPPPPPPPRRLLDKESAGPSVWTAKDLKNAALSGNVMFLLRTIEDKVELECYYTVFLSDKATDDVRGTRQCGNIFHLAVLENKVDFIKVAILKVFQPVAIQTLLTQQQSHDNESNPLHLAVEMGNRDIVKLFLNVFRPFLPSLPSSSLPKPWLFQATDNSRQTLCHKAIDNSKWGIALELLTMDMEIFCNVVDGGAGLLYLAISRGQHNFALKILQSTTNFTCAGYAGHTPLHVVPHCSTDGKEICRLLLERKPDLVEQKSENGYSVFHYWAKEGKLWPFEFVLKEKPEVKKNFISLISAKNDNGYSPIHILAKYAHDEGEAVKIAKLLVNTYEGEDVFPWLVETETEDTPLSCAICRHFEDLAIYILSVDKNALTTMSGNALFYAIKCGCHKVAEKIMEIVEEEKWTHLLTDDQNQHVLHLAPLCTPFCTKEFFERLLTTNPTLLEASDNNGNRVIHKWLEIGKAWPFEYFLKEADKKLKDLFINLIPQCDYNKNNPFHVAATSCHAETDLQIVKLLVEAYTEKNPDWRSAVQPLDLPWCHLNASKQGPLHQAINNNHQMLVTYLWSLHGTDDHRIVLVLDCYYEQGCNTLFHAIQKKFYGLAEDIISKLNEQNRVKHFTESPNSTQNILHLAPDCTEDFGKWLFKKAPAQFIKQRNNDKLTPLHLAFDAGVEWLIKEILEKDPSALDIQPLPWIKACEKGHVSAIRALINCSENFNKHCSTKMDSPLHHIKLRDLTEYESFLEFRYMKDLINLKDSKGETPLHKAIRNGDISLTETLLKMDNIKYNIKDQSKKSAQGLLGDKCAKLDDWDQMCKRVKFNPKTRNLQHRTNLLEARQTLSLVAALLATITFTAGFTLPGGFNQDTGEAILAKKTAFLVFIISDALAMCCSMVVLICLVWSVVDDSNESMLYVDRSMTLLKLALYSTLLAFMTGVFVVISPRSLWAAILIIVMCSIIIIFSANRNILYKVLEKIIPTQSEADENQDRLLEFLEQGRAYLCRRGGPSCPKRD